MKLASYNVESLFERAKAMNGATWSEGSKVLGLHAQFNAIIGKTAYTAADKKRIVALMEQLGLEKSDDGKFVVLRQNRGHLVKRGKNGLEIVADGRADWIGWLDLAMEAVNEVATQNTARVINDLDADVLGIVEAESRPSLLHFSDDVMKGMGAEPFGHVMLIDGNDERGIDVAIATHADYPIAQICSHVDDSDGQGVIFSRDCAEYTVVTPKGNRLTLLVNHFKSKGYGSQATSDAKRKRQASRVKEIYEQHRRAGMPYVAVMGDFNDTPDSDAVSPLLADTDLKDISRHAGFEDGGRPGTYGTGAKSNKIDFILLSPELFDKTAGGGIFRKGVWGGKNGDMWEHYPEMTKPADAASDHAAIWAEIDL